MANEVQVFSYTTIEPTLTAHPHFIEATKFKRNGKETGEAKYSGVWCFEPASEDLANLKAKAAEAAKARWPGRPLGELQFPFKSGDKEWEKRVAKLKSEGKEDDNRGDFMKGKVLMKASSKFQPKLSVWLPGAKAPVELTDESAFKAHGGKFYFGVKSMVEVNFVPYDAVREGDKDGVTAYVQQVCSLNVGERLAGARSAAETFKGYAGKVSTEDPTAGKADTMDDEIPF